MNEPSPSVTPRDDVRTVVTAGRLFTAVWGLALLAIVIGVGRHGADGILALMPDSGSLGERLAAVPTQAWWFTVLHLLAAMASLGVGYLAISFAYPRRHLLSEVHANPAAAIQASAHLLGATAVATASWGGTDAQSLLVSAVFCILGWMALIAICAGHRAVTRYHDHEEIADGNIAAALASAGLHVGVALVVGHAIQGQFTGWSSSLSGFALALAWALLLFPLRQLVLARVILRLTPRDMDAAIATRHDAWLGAAEGLFYLLSALCLSAGW
jgi:uncharacterized membrane protein YjfL (UPF0719 family)